MAQSSTEKVRRKITREARKVRKALAKIGSRVESYTLELPGFTNRPGSLPQSSPRASVTSMQQLYRTPSRSPHRSSDRGPLVIRNPDLVRASVISMQQRYRSSDRGTLVVGNPDSPQTLPASQDPRDLLQDQNARIQILDPDQPSSRASSPGNNRRSWPESLKSSARVASRFVAGLTSDQYPVVPEDLLSTRTQRPRSGEDRHPLSFSARAERLASTSEASLPPSEQRLTIGDATDQPSLQGPGSRYPPFQASQEPIVVKQVESQDIRPVNLRTISSTRNPIPPKPVEYKAYKPLPLNQVYSSIPASVPIRLQPRLPSPLRVGSSSAAPRFTSQILADDPSLFLTVPKANTQTSSPSFNAVRPEHRQTFKNEDEQGKKRTSKVSESSVSAETHRGPQVIKQERERQIEEERKTMYERLSQALEDWGEFKVEF